MYMTMQRRLLFDFFSKHPDVSITARDLYQELNKNDLNHISLSAIYRNLAILAKSGLIIQLASKDNKESIYRYSSDKDCEHKLHMTCLHCGTTYHISEKISDKLASEVLDNDDFSIDESQTTIYGICKKCK